MLSSNYKIIAVDNEQEELDRIEECFRDLRIACYPLLYSSGDTPPEKFKGIRLAFFDVNLSIGNPNDQMLCNIISSALKNILAHDNGPYALIFWSLHASKLAAIKEYIETREKDNIPSPIFVDTIDKVGIVSSDDLKRELERILSNPTLNIIFDYENKAMLAASRTINSLFNLVPRDGDKWGDNTAFDSNFDKVFSKIAVEATGEKYAAENPKLSIQKGISPILIHNIHNQSLTEVWDSKLSLFSKPKFPTGFRVGVLNSTYHIDNTKFHGNDARGCIVSSKLQHDYQKLLGKSKRAILEQMFKFQGNANAEQDRKIKAFLSKCDFVLLEISAACDYAQNNHRIYKYMLGIEYPIENEIVKKSEKDGNYVFHSPVFSLNGKEVALKFNFRYIIGLNPSDDKLGEIKYRLNDNILNQIGNQYSAYVSRLGTVTFY